MNPEEVVVGAGFESAIRQPPDYEPDLFPSGEKSIVQKLATYKAAWNRDNSRMGRTKAIPRVSFGKETIGGRWQYWRARVGKKLTGDKAIQRALFNLRDGRVAGSNFLDERTRFGAAGVLRDQIKFSPSKQVFETGSKSKLLPAQNAATRCLRLSSELQFMVQVYSLLT